MAVTAVTEKPDSPTATFTSDGKRSYTRVFYVTSDDQNDGPFVIRSSSLVVQPGDYYAFGRERDTGAFANSITPKRNGELPTEWELTANYESEEASTEDDTQVDNPLNEPVQLSFSAGFFPQVLEQDADNKPVLNTLGRPFDPPIETDQHYLIMRIVQNTPFYNAFDMAGFVNTVNAERFLGIPAGLVKCVDVQGTKQFKGTVDPNIYVYWQRTFEFHIREIGWDLFILNRGFYAWIDAEKPALGVKKIVDGDGKPVVEPALLSEAGEHITEEALKFLGAVPHYERFKPYKARSYITLGLE